MTDLGRALALLLAAVLVWAAVAKLRRPDETSKSFGDLGLPAPRALAWTVPGIELAIAGWLVLAPAAAAWAVVALLAGFTVVLARGIAAGVPCACFGSTSTEGLPVSAREIVRNALLAGAAVVATGSGPGDALWPEPAALAVAAVSAVAGWSLLRVWRQREPR